MTYQRIEQLEDLPLPGPLNARAREKQDLDFKRHADKGQLCEHAKDIAAFANSLGEVAQGQAEARGNRPLAPFAGHHSRDRRDLALIGHLFSLE